MKGSLLAGLFCIGALTTFGQAKTQTQSTSLESKLPTKVYAPKATKKKKKNKVTYDAKDKFYDRIEENARAKRKNEKKMLSPQYSNFQYYGHKKPPKKRPPEKMKYCKICGIRH
jgi:hypothetical protein